MYIYKLGLYKREPYLTGFYAGTTDCVWLAIVYVDSTYFIWQTVFYVDATDGFWLAM
jgi:hypothetical protein